MKQKFGKNLYEMQCFPFNDAVLEIDWNQNIIIC